MIKIQFNWSIKYVGQLRFHSVRITRLIPIGLINASALLGLAKIFAMTSEFLIILPIGIKFKFSMGGEPMKMTKAPGIESS